MLPFLTSQRGWEAGLKSLLLPVGGGFSQEAYWYKDGVFPSSIWTETASLSVCPHAGGQSIC